MNCYDLHRLYLWIVNCATFSSSGLCNVLVVFWIVQRFYCLIYFSAKVTVWLLFYLILSWLVFAEVTIGIPWRCQSYIRNSLFIPMLQSELVMIATLLLSRHCCLVMEDLFNKSLRLIFLLSYPCNIPLTLVSRKEFYCMMLEATLTLA